MQNLLSSINANTWPYDLVIFFSLPQTQYSVLLTDDGAKLFLQQPNIRHQCRDCHHNTAWFFQTTFAGDLEKTLLVKYIRLGEFWRRWFAAMMLLFVVKIKEVVLNFVSIFFLTLPPSHMQLWMTPVCWSFHY